MPGMQIGASVPPDTITSARPSWICEAAVRMAWADVAQAEETPKLGPRKPNLMAMWPEAMLVMNLGIKKGLNRGFPLSK